MNDENITTKAARNIGLNLHITLAMAFAGIRAVVSEFGRDHTASGPDGGCVYMKADPITGFVSPICIVGQVFARLGLLRLLTVDHSNPGTNHVTFGNGLYGTSDGACNLAGFNDTIVSWLAGFGVTLDADAAEFLRLAQSHQDGGMAWGEAFDLASDWLVDRVKPTDMRSSAVRIAEHLGL